MHAPTSHRLPVLDRLAAPLPGDGGPENPIHRWASDRALCHAIGGHLEGARSRLEEVIAACARRESQADLVEVDDRGQAVLHHLTEIDSLERLRDHLDGIAARFHAAMPLTEVRYAAGPFDIARDDSLHRLDLALSEQAGALARRFDDPAVRHDLLAHLESDLSDFERILDERALLLSHDEYRRVPEHPDRTGAVRPAKGFGMAEEVRIRGGRDEELSREFEEHLDALRQVDRALRQVGRCVTEARGDPPLQEFWRGVKRDYEEEAHRLVRWIGEEAIRLSEGFLRGDDRPGDRPTRRTTGGAIALGTNQDGRPRRGPAVSQAAGSRVNRLDE